MPGITLAQAQAQLNAWLEASIAVTKKQSYEIDIGNGRRSLTLVNAEHIQGMITFWQEKVSSLTTSAEGGRRRVRYVVPE
jgi:hypothetical protein